MTDSTRPYGAQDPQHSSYPEPPAYPPQQPVTTAGGVTVWPGDSAGDGGDGGRPPYAGFAEPAPQSPAPRGGHRARKPVALLAAVAIVAAVVGGGSAALVGELTSRADHVSQSTPVQNASSRSSGGVAAVAKAVSPSIVEIKASTTSGQSTGSGVIITGDGEIVTNNHVVAGADTVQVVFSDGGTKTAKVVGTDPGKDLALIKVQGASGLKAAKLGDSGKVRVGDEVVAIGSPEGLTGTVTSGIVSALDRDVTVSKEQGQGQGQGRQRRGVPQWPFEFGGNQYNGDTGSSKTTYKALQTDASLNPGNSGGALINMNGEIIGINSAMYAPSSATGSGDSAGSVGLGFAIPVDTVKADLAKLRAGGGDS
ncbi:trypsin-like serine protease [Streptomyces rectiverticillatus]|uniref:S1C family serine protease n=1 Tax=Streptomyces rectiverticillatus TaxID=173860 RepID=UPI0015C3C5C2|nr:trypsin-like peptidase domain-containing protein [Streptomyces rectiverticillatus]QLE73390.1 trypsin-like serine protease [Streptomyces rectiverticillatus]